MFQAYQIKAVYFKFKNQHYVKRYELSPRSMEAILQKIMLFESHILTPGNKFFCVNAKKFHS